MPQKIGKFEIIRTLGRGAMGEVYLALDPAIGRQVALKTILPALGTAEDLKARFAREATAAGTLNHPNVVTVFEYGEDQGLLYLAMEYVDGRDLQALLSERTLDAREILEAVAQVCDGLQHAHRHGVIHRDVKPSNVMVLQGEDGLQAKVMDFGVAKASGAEVTQTGQVVGTLAYMAPEYLRHGQASPRSDLFSVAVMLFEALSGEKPFAGETTGATVYNIIHEAPRPLDVSRLPGVSPALRQVVERALAKDPDGRFASAADLAKALRAAKDPAWGGPDDATRALARPVDAASVGGFRQDASVVPGARRSQPLWVWAMAGGLVLALGLAGWALLRPRTAPAEGRAAAEDPEHERLNGIVLDKAARMLDVDPKGALEMVQAVIDDGADEGKADPATYALKLVIYYRMNDRERFGEALAEARFRGVKGSRLLEHPRFKAMLEKDKQARRLSDELRGRLLKGEL